MDKTLPNYVFSSKYCSKSKRAGESNCSYICHLTSHPIVVSVSPVSSHSPKTGKGTDLQHLKDMRCIKTPIFSIEMHNRPTELWIKMPDLIVNMIYILENKQMFSCNFNCQSNETMLNLFHIKSYKQKSVIYLYFIYNQAPCQNFILQLPL